VQVVQAYRFALDPTSEQARMFNSHAGAARFAYNQMLAVVLANWGQRTAEKTYGIEADQLTPSLSWSFYSLRKEWNRRKPELAPWWRENAKESYATGIERLAVALKNWSDSRKGLRLDPKMRVPRFRSKRATRSFRFSERVTLDAGRHHVKLPRIGLVKTHESVRKLARRIEAGSARIGRATIAFHRGCWFVSFVAHVERVVAVQSGSPVVGVDLGVKELAVVATADGHEIERVSAPRHLRGAQNKIKALQRKAARQVGPWDAKSKRRQDTSRGWLHTQKLIRRAHARAAWLREDDLHRLTTRLARENAVVVIEDLNVKGMAAAGGAHKRGLNRSLADAAFGQFRRMLEYKGAWYGAKIVVADRWFPSSKTCSECGVVKAKLPLSERLFLCDCGAALDRDLNAAINLARLGLDGAEWLLRSGGADVRPAGSPVGSGVETASLPAGTSESQGSDHEDELIVSGVLI